MLHPIAAPEGIRKNWTVDDTSFASYVSMVYFRDGPAIDCIERQVGHDPTNVGLDLAGGSHGRAVAGMADYGLIGKGVCATYADLRDPSRTPPNVSFVFGDLLSQDTRDKIKAEQARLAPEGFSLVTFRPYGALDDLDKETCLDGVQFVLSIMRAAGVFYAQIPGSPYEAPDYNKLNALFTSIKAMDDVGRIEVSDRTRTLSDYNFSLIYKRAR